LSLIKLKIPSSVRPGKNQCPCTLDRQSIRCLIKFSLTFCRPRIPFRPIKNARCRLCLPVCQLNHFSALSPHVLYIYIYTLYIYPGHYPCQGQSSVCMCVCARVLLAWKTNRNQLKSRVRSRISTCTCQRPLGAINCEELFRLPAAASGFGRGRP